MDTSKRIGGYLALLREKAGLNQNELAQKVTWGPTILSRVESGERAISHDELMAILKAIGTEEALRFIETSDRHWHYLPEPPFGHPDEQTIWEAELALRSIAELSELPDIKNVFVKRLDEYKSSLFSAAELVWDTEYTIAFVGDIGAGKSTAICRATDLEVEVKEDQVDPVLESGGGGVTICDVYLAQGPDYGILVEPINENDLRREVNEFAEYLMADLKAGEDNASSGHGIQGTSKEIARAIRNMSSLQTVRVRQDGGKRRTMDPAKTLARNFAKNGQDANALTAAILSRMGLHQRTRRELWYPDMSRKTPLRWLRDVFLEVNNGRNRDFSIPKRVEILVPEPILAEESLTIRLVDTKGIDGTAAREDIEFHFSEAKSITILCSQFNDAPSNSAQQLLQRALDGQIPDLNTKTAVLVLPRPEEALAVKTDQGEPAEDKEDGYEMKGEQVEMILDSRHLPTARVEFFNVREDDVQDLRDFLLTMVRNLRTLHVMRLSDVISEAKALAENYVKEQQSEILRSAAHRLKVWMDKNQVLASSDTQLENSLLSAVGSAHHSSVRASVRRNGEWYNLSYPYQLGHGSRVKASRMVLEKKQAFSTIVQNILDDPEMDEAHDLVRQAQRLFDTRVEAMLDICRQMGVAIHTNSLEPDAAFWNQCRGRWGQGPGYRNDVLDYNKKWFETNRASVDDDVLSIIGKEWEAILQRLSEILDFD